MMKRGFEYMLNNKEEYYNLQKYKKMKMRNNMKALKFWAIKTKQKIWLNGLKIYTKYI